MKSFFFQVLYCGYKRFGSDFFIFFFTKGRNPHGSKENSNTIYRPDLTYGSDAGAAVYSRLQEIEMRVLTIPFTFKIATICNTLMEKTVTWITTSTLL